MNRRSMFVFVDPDNDLALVAELPESKLPHHTIIYPAPIDTVIASLLVGHCADSIGAWRTEKIQAGFNTHTIYDRVQLPKDINPDDFSILLECKIIEFSIKESTYRVGISTDDDWSFLMFAEINDDRHWFKVNRNYSSKREWMELIDLASFQGIYLESIQW